MKKNFIILIFTAFYLFSPYIGSAFQQGYASWYGGKFHGRITASGEVFNTNELTAAHRSLPFGSIVKVTNLENGKFVVVRINDRGPFVEGRIIDLSRAAAEAIGMVGKGIARVKLEVLSMGSSNTVYKIQIAAYREQKNAEKLKYFLEKNDFQAIFEYGENGIIRVMLENVLKDELDKVLSGLRGIGIRETLVLKDVPKQGKK